VPTLVELLIDVLVSLVHDYSVPIEVFQQRAILLHWVFGIVYSLHANISEISGDGIVHTKHTLSWLLTQIGRSIDSARFLMYLLFAVPVKK